jgi:hypothetical protein
MSPVPPVESLQDVFELVCYVGAMLGVLFSVLLQNRA